MEAGLLTSSVTLRLLVLGPSKGWRSSPLLYCVLRGGDTNHSPVPPLTAVSSHSTPRYDGPFGSRPRRWSGLGPGFSLPPVLFSSTIRRRILTGPDMIQQSSHIYFTLLYLWSRANSSLLAPISVLFLFLCLYF